MKKTASKAGSSKSNMTSKKKQEGDGSQLKVFLVDALKDMYWAEKHLLKAIPKMAKAATNEDLVNAFENHLEQTEQQVARLEEVFEMLEATAQAKKCEAMEGLTREAESIIAETERGSLTRDAALIIAAQKVEHYEIASYGGLVQLARTLGENEAANLLKETLEEEKETDELLTELAENHINEDALAEVQEDEDE